MNINNIRDGKNDETVVAEGFVYSYSAAQREEIKRIKEKYEKKEDNKMERLRALDAAVTTKGTVASLIMGIIGALMLGVGMCCSMVWGEGNTLIFAIGIAVGLFGIAATACAYPVYNFVTKKERERLAPEIIRLSDELLNK